MNPDDTTKNDDQDVTAAPAQAPAEDAAATPVSAPMGDATPAAAEEDDEHKEQAAA